MAGIAKPGIANLGDEVIATNISGIGDYSTNPLALFDGVTTGGAYPFSIFYWRYSNEYIQFTIDKTVHIWRSPSPNYLTYQLGGVLIQRLASTWEDVTLIYPQKVTALAAGQWEKFITDLPAGTYRFLGDNNSIRIDAEWYLEGAAPHVPKNYEGQVIDDTYPVGAMPHVKVANLLAFTIPGIRDNTAVTAQVIQQIDSGEKNNSIKEGLEPEVAQIGLRSSIKKIIELNEVYAGSKGHRNNPGESIDVSSGLRMSKEYEGIDLEPITASSDAQYKFTLTVTPTHQYKNRIVTVHSVCKYAIGIHGKTRLLLGGSVVIPYGTENTTINIVDYTIMPSMLVKGSNHCRLEYRYEDGTEEYLDFIVVKEETMRTLVERTFHNYDGGYDGNRFTPSYNAIPSKYPCFMVPDGKTDTVIKTTEYTSIPLARYTGLQGVQIGAAGARILVSFDKGMTYKSLINGVWEAASLDSIATTGMTAAAINSIVFARWQELFKPLSLDFAIYLNNSNSEFVNDASRIYTGMYRAITSAGLYVSPSPGLYFSKIDYTLSNISGNGTSVTYSEKIHGSWVGKVNNGYGQTVTGVSDYNGFKIADRPTQIYGSMETNGYVVGNSGCFMYVYEAPQVAYLKYINLQITPRLKMGYAFVM